MSEKLKTLKEIHLGNPTLDGAFEDSHNVVDCYELRDEAIRWVKDMIEVLEVREQPIRECFMGEWFYVEPIFSFTTFFNLTEKDLQNGICDNTNIKEEPEKD